MIAYQPDLEGKKAQFQYKPTERSRKWRDGFIVLTYSETAHDYAAKLQKQLGYHACRFVEYK